MTPIASIDPRLAQALRLQFARRRALLDGGAEHVGWKLVIGDGERIGEDVVVGYLTSATVMPPGGSCRVYGGSDLRADVEIAVQLSDVPPSTDPDDVIKVIATMAVALEIVDLGGDDDAFTVVAGNVFHRAVAFGEFRPVVLDWAEATLSVNGQRRRSKSLHGAIAERIGAASRILSGMGHPLQTGDRIITGNIAQVSIRPGDSVTADIDRLGSVTLAVAGSGPAGG